MVHRLHILFLKSDQLLGVTRMIKFIDVPWKLLASLLFTILIIFPTTSLSQQLPTELILAPSQKTELAGFIRECEYNKKMYKVADEQLTRCEFDRECSTSFKDLGVGFLIGVIAGGIAMANR